MKREKPPLATSLFLAACVTATVALVSSELGLTTRQNTCAKPEIFRNSGENRCTETREEFDLKLVRRRDKVRHHDDETSLSKFSTRLLLNEVTRTRSHDRDINAAQERRSLNNREKVNSRVIPGRRQKEMNEERVRRVTASTRTEMENRNSGIRNENKITENKRQIRDSDFRRDVSMDLLKPIEIKRNFRDAETERLTSSHLRRSSENERDERITLRRSNRLEFSDNRFSKLEKQDDHERSGRQFRRTALSTDLPYENSYFSRIRNAEIRREYIRGKYEERSNNYEVTRRDGDRTSSRPERLESSLTSRRDDHRRLELPTFITREVSRNQAFEISRRSLERPAIRDSEDNERFRSAERRTRIKRENRSQRPAERTQKIPNNRESRRYSDEEATNKPVKRVNRDRNLHVRTSRNVAERDMTDLKSSRFLDSESYGERIEGAFISESLKTPVNRISTETKRRASKNRRAASELSLRESKTRRGNLAKQRDSNRQPVQLQKDTVRDSVRTRPAELYGITRREPQNSFTNRLSGNESRRSAEVRLLRSEEENQFRRTFDKEHRNVNRMLESPENRLSTRSKRDAISFQSELHSKEIQNSERELQRIRNMDNTRNQSQRDAIETRRTRDTSISQNTEREVQRSRNMDIIRNQRSKETLETRQNRDTFRSQNSERELQRIENIDNTRNQRTREAIGTQRIRDSPISQNSERELQHSRNIETRRTRDTSIRQNSERELQRSRHTETRRTRDTSINHSSEREHQRSRNSDNNQSQLPKETTEVLRNRDISTRLDSEGNLKDSTRQHSRNYVDLNQRSKETDETPRTQDTFIRQHLDRKFRDLTSHRNQNTRISRDHHLSKSTDEQGAWESRVHENSDRVLTVSTRQRSENYRNVRDQRLRETTEARRTQKNIRRSNSERELTGSSTQDNHRPRFVAHESRKVRDVDSSRENRITRESKRERTRNRNYIATPVRRNAEVRFYRERRNSITTNKEKRFVLQNRPDSTLDIFSNPDDHLNRPRVQTYRHSQLRDNSVIRESKVFQNVSPETFGNNKSSGDLVIRILHLLKDIVILSCLILPMTNYFESKKRTDEKKFKFFTDESNSVLSKKTPKQELWSHNLLQRFVRADVAVTR